VRHEGFARVRKALEEDPAAQAETLAALAMIDACAGHREEAVERARHAIDAAEQLGQPEVFIRTARSAAEVYLLLADRTSAAKILESALAAIATAEGTGIELPAEDVLAVLVSHLDASVGGDVPALHRALKLAPLVLEDANAWWDLPRLAAHAQAHPELQQDATLDLALATVAMLASQRCIPA
jgi:hypothetical protein